MREHHDANRSPFHPTLQQYDHEAGVGPEMHPLESSVGDNVGIPSDMVSVSDFHAL